MHCAVNSRSGWHAVGRRVGTLFNWVNRSYSQGTVELASADAMVEPEVDFRLLSDRRDLLRLADAFRLSVSLLEALARDGTCVDPFPSTYSARVKRWLKPTQRNGVLMGVVAPVMDRVGAVRQMVLRMAQEGTPPVAALCAEEDLLHAHLRRHVGGVWHPSGSCRMGAPSDPMAVCDPAGRVIGIEALMVCDASLMPQILCANLNVPVLMMAEKIADGIRGRVSVASTMG